MLLNIVVTLFIILVCRQLERTHIFANSSLLISIFSACNDLYGQCETSLCTDPIGKEICSKTCGFCVTTPSPTVIPTCEDKYNKCKSIINCASEFAKELCAKTCGFCDDSTPSLEECSYLCKPLQALCEFIGWMVGPTPHGFCFRCQQCK
uniref:ShKT domain-containing protein n=1 Tax=Elaeophora elaphi TaxID=1147741 RepID=A0A0R3S2T9_9BILA